MDFKADLFGEPSRISANLVTQSVTSGYVQINGVATGLASQPLWDFGDGTVVGSWFPAEHTYVVETSANLSAGGFTTCSPVIAVPSGFSGSTTNYLHSGGPLSAQRYYRVRLAS
jgi:hypothetical protein